LVATRRGLGVLTGFKLGLGAAIAVILIILLLMAFGIEIFPPVVIEEERVEPPVREELYVKTAPIKFSVYDQFAGGGIGSVSISVFKGDIQTDSITTSANGTAKTTQVYTSGDVLDVKLTKGSAKQWFKVTVPKVGYADVQLECIHISIPFWTYNKWTVKIRDNLGNDYDKNDWVNKSVVGNTFTLSVNIFQSVNNRGFRESSDPLIPMDWKAFIYIRITGTDFEKVRILTGPDSGTEKGVSMYYWKEIDENSLTRWVVGNDVKLEGATSASFGFDMTGYTGTTVDAIFELVIYTDSGYFDAYGSYGPDALTVETITLNIKGT